jgi:hypothetical protein
LVYIYIFLILLKDISDTRGKNCNVFRCPFIGQNQRLYGACQLFLIYSLTLKGLRCIHKTLVRCLSLWNNLPNLLCSVVLLFCYQWVFKPFFQYSNLWTSWKMSMIFWSYVGLIVSWYAFQTPNYRHST